MFILKFPPVTCSVMFAWKYVLLIVPVKPVVKVARMFRFAATADIPVSNI